MIRNSPMMSSLSTWLVERHRKMSKKQPVWSSTNRISGFFDEAWGAQCLVK